MSVCFSNNFAIHEYIDNDNDNDEWLHCSYSIWTKQFIFFSIVYCYFFFRSDFVFCFVLVWQTLFIFSTLSDSLTNQNCPFFFWALFFHSLSCHNKISMYSFAIDISINSFYRNFFAVWLWLGVCLKCCWFSFKCVYLSVLLFWFSCWEFIFVFLFFFHYDTETIFTALVQKLPKLSVAKINFTIAATWAYKHCVHEVKVKKKSIEATTNCSNMCCVWSRNCFFLYLICVHASCPMKH